MVQPPPPNQRTPDAAPPQARQPHHRRSPLPRTRPRPRCLGRLALTTVLGCLTAVLTAQEMPQYTRTQDVFYGFKYGVGLTLDVFRPQPAHGYGVIHVISGTSWMSARENIGAANYRTFLQRGYTVFAVVHGAPPKFHVEDMIQDLQRAVRFVRHEADRYGVRADRLGLTGMAGGGHLALMVAALARPGQPEAPDPVDREPSTVAAVSCFFPQTDFLDWGTNEPKGLPDSALVYFQDGLGLATNTTSSLKDLCRRISPALQVTSNLPPTLLIHGTADPVIPFQQSESFVRKAQAAGAVARLVAKEGRGHGWQGMWDDLESELDWFDEHLRGLTPATKPAASSSPPSPPKPE